MTIKHDDQGFLIGHRVENDNVIDLLEAIRKEIKSLREDVSGGALVALPKRDAPAKDKESSSKSVVASPASSLGLGLASAAVSPRASESTAQSQAAQGLQSKPSDKKPAIDVKPEKVEGSSTTNNFYSGDTSTSVASNNFSATTVSLPAGGSAAPALVALPKDRSEKVATPKPVKSGARDSKGRFLPKAGESDSERGFSVSGDDDSVSDQILVSAISDMGEKITGAVGELAFSEESDPSVKAFNEIAKPLQRGYSKIFGDGENKGDDRWYRRFWRELRLRKKVDKKQHKEQIDLLEDIEKKGEGSKGGFLKFLMPLFGLLAGLFKALIPLKLLGFLKNIPGMPGSRRSATRANRRSQKRQAKTARPQAAAGVKTKDSNPASTSTAPKTTNAGAGTKAGAGGAARGAARRIPLLGALLTLVSVAQGVKASESDEDSTRREKDVNTGAAIGSGAGALTGAMAGGSLGGTAGAAIGTMIFPGVGTAIGGAIGALAGAVGGAFLGESAGDIIGAQFGEWVSDLRDSEFVQSMAGTWNTMTTFTGHLWGQASAAVSERWDAVTDTVGSAFAATTGYMSAGWDAVTGMFGAVTETISSAWSKALDGMKSGWDSVINKVSGWWDSIGDTAKKANDWFKEKTGIDVAEKISSAGDVVAGAANSVWGFAKGTLSKAGSAVSSAASAVGETTGVSKVYRAVKRSADYTVNKSALEQQMLKSGITNPKEQAAFMGQMHHESGGMTSLEENLNYKPKQFLKLFGKRAGISTEEEAAAIISQGKVAQGEAMYGGEWGAKNLGNTEPGDGHAFRGRGFTQLTGRSNYAQASKALGVDLVSNPDLASDPEMAAKIATWYWESRGLGEAGRAGDVEGVTKGINGGLNGLADRKEKTAMYAAEYSKNPIQAVPSRKQEEIAKQADTVDTAEAGSESGIQKAIVIQKDPVDISAVKVASKGPANPAAERRASRGIAEQDALAKHYQKHPPKQELTVDGKKAAVLPSTGMKEIPGMMDDLVGKPTEKPAVAAAESEPAHTAQSAREKLYARMGAQSKRLREANPSAKKTIEGKTPSAAPSMQMREVPGSVVAMEPARPQAVAIKAAPTVPMPSEPPEVKAPLSSGASGGSERKSTAGNQEVSRDLADRRIAHVVTGAHSQL